MIFNLITRIGNKIKIDLMTRVNTTMEIMEMPVIRVAGTG
jgi:hypothetical protein